MRRHIRAAASAQGPSLRVIQSQIRRRCSWLPLRCHSIFERTLRGEVVAATDPAFDADILQLILGVLRPHLVLLVRRAAGLEAHLRPEHDVFTHARGVRLRPQRPSSLRAEFGPLSPFGHARIHLFPDDRLLDAARLFNFLTILADYKGDDGFASVFVFGDLRRWESGGEVFVFFFGPVGASKSRISLRTKRSNGFSYTLLVVTLC